MVSELEQEGVGCIELSPLAQGVLTGKYAGGIPDGSRAAQDTSLSRDQLSPEILAHVAALGEVARARGQSLAQLALSWALRDPRVTSVLIGASSVAQLEENLAAAGRGSFTDSELAEIDRDAGDAGINIWAASSADQTGRRRDPPAQVAGPAAVPSSMAPRGRSRSRSMSCR